MTPRFGGGTGGAAAGRLRASFTSRRTHPAASPARWRSVTIGRGPTPRLQGPSTRARREPLRLRRRLPASAGPLDRRQPEPRQGLQLRLPLLPGRPHDAGRALARRRARPRCRARGRCCGAPRARSGRSRRSTLSSPSCGAWPTSPSPATASRRPAAELPAAARAAREARDRLAPGVPLRLLTNATLFHKDRVCGRRSPTSTSCGASSTPGREAYFQRRRRDAVPFQRDPRQPAPRGARAADRRAEPVPHVRRCGPRRRRDRGLGRAPARRSSLGAGASTTCRSTRWRAFRPTRAAGLDGERLETIAATARSAGLNGPPSMPERRQGRTRPHAARSGIGAASSGTSHELRLRDHVALHRRLELRLRRRAEVGQHGVERVELVEVAVPADRRAGPAVAGALPVVRALARARRQVLRRTACARPRAEGGSRRAPSGPRSSSGAFGSGASGSSTIRTRLLRRRRGRRSSRGRRDVAAFAGEEGGDLAAGANAGEASRRVPRGPPSACSRTSAAAPASTRRPRRPRRLSATTRRRRPGCRGRLSVSATTTCSGFAVAQ